MFSLSPPRWQGFEADRTAVCERMIDYSYLVDQNKIIMNKPIVISIQTRILKRSVFLYTVVLSGANKAKQLLRAIITAANQSPFISPSQRIRILSTHEPLPVGSFLIWPPIQTMPCLSQV